MAFEVIFKKRFINNLVKVQSYLEKEWGNEIAASFLKKIDNRQYVESLSKIWYSFRKSSRHKGPVNNEA